MCWVHDSIVPATKVDLAVREMRKARVLVWLKKEVLDPQGRTITEALHNLGYDLVRDVRQGKMFEVWIDAAAKGEEELLSIISEMSRRLLSNPVIEDFKVELL